MNITIFGVTYRLERDEDLVALMAAHTEAEGLAVIRRLPVVATISTTRAA